MLDVLVFAAFCLIYVLKSTLKIAREYERAVIFRFGRLISQKPAGPGLFIVIPFIDKFTIIDMRLQVFIRLEQIKEITFNKCAQIPCRDVLTKDSASLSVDGIIMFRIHDAIKSVQNVEDCAQAITALGSTTLRNMLGISTLNDILFGAHDDRY